MYALSMEWTLKEGLTVVLIVDIWVYMITEGVH